MTPGNQEPPDDILGADITEMKEMRIEGGRIYEFKEIKTGIRSVRKAVTSSVDAHRAVF